MSKSITMEVFRAGTQTDSKGDTEKYTEADLDKIIQKFEEVGDDVPAVVSKEGHPEGNVPGFAWFKKFFRKGEILFAEMSDIVPEFGVMLKNKMFPRRSIAFTKDFRPIHIAFLGSNPPAVKGLENFAFKANEESLSYEFEEAEGEKLTLKTIKDFVTKLFKEKSTEDQEMATIEELNAKIEGLEKKFSDKEAAFETEKKQFEEKEKEFCNEKKKFEDDLAAEKKRADDAEAKFAEDQKAAKKKEFTDYLDGEIEAGRVLPANKDVLLKTMETLDGQEAMTFSEGDKTEKITPLEVFKKQISAGNPQVKFGEHFGNGQEPNTAGERLKQFAEKIQNENKEISFGDAFRKAQDQHPELTELYNKAGI